MNPENPQTGKNQGYLSSTSERPSAATAGARNAGGSTMYNKLFTKILDSSVWLESNTTRLIWFTFLAAMDEDGFCQFASLANLAHRARVELADAKVAVECLEGPDENSSDPDNEGRRIERVSGGWIVLNAGKYRALVTREAIKEKTRERVARHRARKHKETAGNGSETACNAKVTQSETDSKAGAEATHRGKKEKVSNNLPTSEPAIRISNLFSRRLTTAWSHKEIQTFKAIGKIESDDLSLIEAYYAAERARGDDGCHRRDLQTFLNNFNGELDRARGWKLKTAPKNSSVTKPAMPDYPDGFKDFMDAKQTKHKPFSQWHVGFQQEFIHSEFNKSKK